MSVFSWAGALRRPLIHFGLVLAAGLVFAGMAAAAAPPQIEALRLGERPASGAATRLVLDLSGPAEILVRSAPERRSLDILLIGGAARSLPLPGATGLVSGAKLRELGGGTVLVSVALKEPADIAEVMLLGPEDRGVHGSLGGEGSARGHRLVIDLARGGSRTASPVIFGLPWASHPGEAQRVAQARKFARSASGQRAQATPPGDPAANAEELTRRRDELFGRMITDLTNLEVAFEFASVSAQLGDYEGAIVAYERLLIINPDLPRVRYELGVLYYALKSYPAAQTYLEGVLASASATPELQQQANVLLQQISASKTRHIFLGSATVGLRYQSNGNSAPGSATLRIQGTDVRLQGAGTSRSDWNGFANAYMRHTYAINDSETSPLIESNMTLYGTRQILLPNINLALISATSGLRFKPIDGDSLSLRPHVIGGVIGLDDHLYSDEYGVGIDFTRSMTEKLTLDGTVDARHREFHNFGAQQTLRLQMGEEVGLAVRNRYVLAADQTVGLDFGYRHGSAKAIFNDFNQYSLSGMYQLTYAAPFELTEYPWALVLNAARVWSIYGGPDPSIDPGTRRYDREWRISATSAVTITPVVSMFLQVQSSFIKSTLPNNTYDNVSLLLGLTRSF